MSREKGNIAEAKACKYLTSKKFTIVETNYYAKKMGEIDIIATKDGIYHFVEVKSGINFEPIYNITPSKLNKIIKSVYLYMKQKNLDVAFSIDCIIIKDEEIELFENITF